MTTIRSAVEQYLQMRRSLGFKLEAHGFMLRDFARFLEQHRSSHVTTALAMQWARSPLAAQPAQWSRRLGVVRRFAAHRSAFDPRTEIPPVGLLPYRRIRRTPYVYSDVEIERLLEAARRLPSPSGLRARTYTTFIGLLVVTGLRVSEAIALDDPDDIDARAGVLTIRRTKFGKSRCVPVHASTMRALQRLRESRDRVHTSRSTPALFVGEDGRRLNVFTLRWTFVRLSRQTGLRSPADRRGPRLHDFRHRLAISTLLHWYKRGVDVEQRLPRLSTFLGHGHVTDTYWYLNSVPELMSLVARRLDASVGGRS